MKSVDTSRFELRDLDFEDPLEESGPTPEITCATIAYMAEDPFDIDRAMQRFKDEMISLRHEKLKFRSY